jgi:uncharacterized protein (TIGR02246 family)
MRALRCLGIGVVAVGVAFSAAADHHEGLMAEVRAIGDKMTKALVEDDVEAMLAMYVPDAISLPNFSPRLDGVAAFREHHEQMAAAGMKINSFESEPTDVWQAGGHVIEIGTYEINITMPGAPPIDDRGKYMTVYVRDDDGMLKVKAETWNTDINPMAMGAPPSE